MLDILFAARLFHQFLLVFARKNGVRIDYMCLSNIDMFVILARLAFTMLLEIRNNAEIHVIIFLMFALCTEQKLKEINFDESEAR